MLSLQLADARTDFDIATARLLIVTAGMRPVSRHRFST